jgi:endo-1,4-beta-xylanase
MRKTLKKAIAICIALTAGVPFAGIAQPAAAQPGALPQAGLNYDQYPALREVYKDYFLVGTIDRFDPAPRGDLMAYNFNTVTFENVMKPDATQNSKGTFTFDAARVTISRSQGIIPDVKMIGHTLAWHSQSPNWLWDYPNHDRTVALENLNAHISGVLGGLGGELYSVDVVNEAIGNVDPDAPSDWKTALAKGEGWYQALGWEWVELAFLAAAKVVDDNGWDCKLYYNDFGTESANKAEAIHEMVRDINERYAGRRPNGKQLIEGVGMQGHFNSATKMADVEASVQLFTDLPGVSISFTEIDIEHPNAGALTDAQAIAQGHKYAQLFEILKKYAAGPANTSGNPQVIERVTFWGVDDGASWKASGLPLLWNAPAGGQITGKEALLGALWPEAYLEAHPVIEGGGQGSTYKIPGVYVYSLTDGDEWSGANIILGNDADAWPWSVADEEDGEVAFTPEKDGTYRLTLNYTALGTKGIRVRWVRDNTNLGYTTSDGNVVTTMPPYNTELGPSDVATHIPAHFNKDMVNAGSYTLVTEFTMGGDRGADSLIGNIAIRGTSGGNAFKINWMLMERVSDGEAMFVWDPDGIYGAEPDTGNEPPPETSPDTTPDATPDSSPEPTDTPDSPPPEDESALPIPPILLIALCISLITVVGACIFGVVSVARSATSKK